MRILILKDSKIKDDQLKAVQQELSDIYMTNAGIKITYFIEEQDFSDYPVIYDPDGDGKLPRSYIKKFTSDIYERYRGEGTDHVVFLIHEDNWKLDGIWGRNYSLFFDNYLVQIARWDRDKPANSLGTLYHEIMHSHNEMVKAYTSKNIDDLFTDIVSWDRTIVHGGRLDGGHPKWDYIRHKENTVALSKIAPLLKEAYQARYKIFEEKNSTYLAIISKLKQAVAILKLLLATKKRYK